MKTKDYIEYTITKKQHKELFPYLSFKYGFIKYKYFANDHNILIEKWFSPLIILYILVGFIPYSLIYGFKDSITSVKSMINWTFKTPMTIDRYGKFGDIYQKNVSKTYELFKKYAIRKK